MGSAMSETKSRPPSTDDSPGDRPPKQIARISLGSVVIWEPGMSGEEQDRRIDLALKLIEDE
jgi:hypothetical protein